MTNDGRDLRKNDKGASVLEFSSAIVVFFAIVFGVIDSGRALYAYSSASHAAWVHLPLAFTFGFILGVVFAFSWFRSKLKFYKQFIERRLSSLNWGRPPMHAGGVR